MGLSVKLVLRVSALAFGAGVSFWAADRAADLVEARSASGLRAALNAGGFDWTQFQVDGLEVRLTGEAPDEGARFRALRAAGSAINPANLHDAMTVAATAALPAPEFRLEILRNDGEITVLGLLPGGGAPRIALLESLAVIDGVDKVTDLLAVTAEAAPSTWQTALDAALGALASLPKGRVELASETLSVAGLSPDHATAASIAGTLRASLPDEIALTTDLSVPPPVVSPFVARFRLDASGGRFDACSASSLAGRDRIEAAARRAGAPADARCFEALGAPNPQWDQVVALGIDALDRAGAGDLTVSDLTITLTPGSGADPAQARTAFADLEAALPPAFTLSVLPLPDAPNPGENGPKAAEFSATLSPEGSAIIRGATGNQNALEIIEGVAKAHFSNDRLRLSLHRQSGLPDGWSVRVLAGLDAFAMLDSGRLSVTPEMLSITGRTGDPTLPTRLTSSLTELLGPSTPFLVNIDYVEKLDPEASRPSPEMCLDQVRAIQADTKITFAPGSTELDMDALRVVRRIAKVLRDCGDADMIIGGHTDSQGSATMNASLSQARADAVFNALIAEKVRSGSLSSRGYGETDPIAANDTETGREANRRIEFRLRYPLLGPPAPPDTPTAADQGQTDGQN
ncbi:MAG: OmpA family protein [Rhodobacteraceae bacterium]|nr:OmpA family protein [Paracoccaceae bacterium]